MVRALNKAARRQPLKVFRQYIDESEELNEEDVVGGQQLADTFLVNIGLPNKVLIQHVEVTRGELVGTDMLIGMDIITSGDFSITNVGGKTIFSIPCSVCRDS